jgi:hypothetical protein
VGCYNDEILFLHIPKCAGTSVKRWLFDNLDGMRGQNPVYPDAADGGFPIGHIPLKDVERYSGRAPESFKSIIAIIRNPYDQQLSQYLFWSDRYKHEWIASGDKIRPADERHFHDTCAASHPRLETWLQDPGSEFHLWYEAHHSNGYREMRPDAAPVTDYYLWWVSINGEVPANLILVKYEDIERGMMEALRPYLGGRDVEPIPVHNTGPTRRATRLYYSQKSAEIVEGKFGWTFTSGFYPKWGWSPEAIIQDIKG